MTDEPSCEVRVKSGAISPGLIAMSNTIQSAVGDLRQDCKHTPLEAFAVRSCRQPKVGLLTIRYREISGNPIAIAPQKYHLRIAEENCDGGASG